MGEDWDLDLADKKYIDSVEEETERMAIRLEALVQQGAVRYYLVNTSRNGKAAKPSVLFSRFFDTDGGKGPQNFDDLLPPGKTARRERWCNAVKGERTDPGFRIPDVQPYDMPFSQSGFRAYYECPYSFQFSSTLGLDKTDYMEFGNLLHHFAELCFSHMDIV